MAADQEYMEFLDKANADVGGASKAREAGQDISTSAVDSSVPAQLQGVEEYYVSEADERFEPIALKWEGEGRGALPSAEEFAQLVGAAGRVVGIGRREFDPAGRYGKVVGLVEGAGGGEVVFFRVELGGARVEYYVVGVVEGKVVGLKARAVES